MSVRTSDTGQNTLKQTLHRMKLASGAHRHPVNVVHHQEATFGERLADKISSGIGSWPFLIVQTVAVGAWMIGNAILFFNFDPKPFILLNLLFSIQAAYTGPVLLLAGNRQAQKDRLTLEHAAEEADKADRQNVEILLAIQHNTQLTEQNTELALQIIKHLQAQLSAHIAGDTTAAPTDTAEREASGRT